MATVRQNGGWKEDTTIQPHSNNAVLAATVDTIEACMRQLKLAKTDEEKKLLDRKCRSLLEKAESLKIAIETRSITVLSASKQPTTERPPGNPIKLQEPRSTRNLSTREQIILLESSKVHGFVFPPWREGPSDSEFGLVPGEPRFRDEAELELSDVQLEIFDGWRRPDKALPPPKVQVSSLPTDVGPTMIAQQNVDLIQDVTTDCSVVASLCAVMARASRGHPNVTSSIFFPYDHKSERPSFSSNGKYIFRLHFNGCFRKVVIDDLLPTSRTARALHVIDRRNPGLLWPALIEKAYLKVRGGYNFPGSNSGTDLWVITGWIPEQLFLQSDITPPSAWHRLFNAFKFGDVLVTIGTGKLTEREEECIGLASEHDYAILDMKEDGDRPMFLVKNPWSEGTVWLTNISASTDHGILPKWLPDQTSVTETKTGILAPGTSWMDLKDVFQNFASIYLNWNPGLFNFREDVHFTWDITPSSRSAGSFAQNPQYHVYSNSGGIVWLLLSRHFTTNSRTSKAHMKGCRADGMNNGGFISLYAFCNNGQKVFLNDGAATRGPYVDSPNALLKLECPARTSYTVVVSEQGLFCSSCNFTLSAFSLEHVSIKEARDKYTHQQTHNGAWTFSTSGGNASTEVYSINPQFSIRLASASDVLVLIESWEKEFPVHVKLLWASGRRINSIRSRDIIGDSGEYRTGSAFAEIFNLQPGAYTIVCSTFEQGQLGKFSLRIGTMSECTVERVPVDEAGRMVHKVRTAVFLPGNNRLLAPLLVRRVTRLSLIAKPQQNKTGSSNIVRSPLRLGLECGQGPSKKVLGVSGSGEYIENSSNLRIKETDIQPNMSNRTGLWIVAERLGCSGIQHSEGVDIDVLSDEPIEVGTWRVGDG